jgi:protein gp37
MGQNSKIEWTHHTFNPWRGCTKVSEGCQHCYAETMSGRNPGTLGVWGPKGTRVVAAENYWRQPAKWNAEAKAAGERRRVFCASLADVFEGEESMPGASVDAVEEARARLWEVIEATPWLDWLLLTKRPRNVVHFAPYAPGAWPYNVWIGTSVENQAAADERIPHLLNVPARVRFLSCEPLLGPVDISRWLICERCKGEGQVTEVFAAGRNSGWMRRVPCPACKGRVWRRDLHWVIVGGESGGKARPMHPQWAHALQEQCQDAGVPFLFKQWGEYVGGTGQRSRFVYLENGQSRAGGVTTHEWGDGYHISERVGKSAAGRLLDGREWNEFPQGRQP